MSLSKKTIAKVNSAAEMLPLLDQFEHTLKGVQIKRDIRIFRDFTTGRYNFEDLGYKYNNLRGSRISQIIKEVEYKLTHPLEEKPSAFDSNQNRRDKAIFDKYSTGEYSYYDLATRYNLSEARVSQIIRDQRAKNDLRVAKETFDESPLLVLR